jgi:hypothetical protein
MLGLTKTVQAGAKVVNFSLGLGDDISSLGPPEDNEQVIAYANLSKAYMRYLLDANYEFIVVQSAGNGQGGYSQDAVYNGYFCSVTYTNMTGITPEMNIRINERIIIVGSAERITDSYFVQAESSNAGSQVDICAPGVRCIQLLCRRQLWLHERHLHGGAGGRGRCRAGVECKTHDDRCGSA